MHLRITGLFIILFGLMACHKNTKPDQKNPLLGAWKVKSVTWVSSDKTHHIEQAQPGMFIFENSHYSLIWSPKRTPRVAFENLSNPTDEEILQGFRSIVFNAGTYQISGDQIVATALVAKVPGFEQGQLFYHFKHENNQLILTMYDETYPDGSKPDWSGKWKTVFTLVQAKN